MKKERGRATRKQYKINVLAQEKNNDIKKRQVNKDISESTGKK